MFVGVDVQPDRVAAVAVEGAAVRGRVLRPLDRDGSGVADALAELVAAHPAAAGARAVSVAQSAAEPALLTPQTLTRTACVRLSPTEAETAPPMSDWPPGLRAAVGEAVFQCAGGHAFDGRATDDVDLAEVDRIAARMRDLGVSTAAITSVFSPVNGAAENAVAARLAELVPGLRVSLSQEIGGIGLFERENATILNASLLRMAEQTARALMAAVRRVIPGARVYLARNDGTVMELAFGSRYPVLTLWSGQACAIHGAALLAGVQDCIVAHVRGATALVGVAQGGFARQALTEADAAGVAVSLRRAATVPVPGRPGGAREPGALAQVVRAVDPTGRLPVVIVGEPVAESLLRGEALRPEYGDVAAAVGAARTRIGGTVDRIVSGDAGARAQAARDAESLALQRAVLAGAVDATVRIVESEELPVAYLPGDFVRLRVQAIGELG